ncbi:MAG TPA: ATP-binding protein, partial [Saprospiraceae bacterium]|nr:ATP-binding protein [Saprospiraceae bacterium]
VAKPKDKPSVERNVTLAYILQILEDRYKSASTIIASQLPTEKWFDFIDEPTIADAIMDRLIPNATKINLKGKSLRNQL